MPKGCDSYFKVVFSCVVIGLIVAYGFYLAVAKFQNAVQGSL